MPSPDAPAIGASLNGRAQAWHILLGFKILSNVVLNASSIRSFTDTCPTKEHVTHTAWYVLTGNKWW